MVSETGLELFLLQGSDVSIIPGPVMLGALNTISIRRKGPMSFYLILIQSIIPPDFVLLQRPRPSGIDGSVGFFMRCSYKPHKIETPVYWPFEYMVVSIAS